VTEEEKKQYEAAVELVAKELADNYDAAMYSSGSVMGMADWIRDASWLFTRSYPNGNKVLAVLSPDQGLPELKDVGDGSSAWRHYQAGWANALNRGKLAGFRRVILPDGEQK